MCFTCTNNSQYHSNMHANKQLVYSVTVLSISDQDMFKFHSYLTHLNCISLEGFAHQAWKRHS